MSDPVSPLYEVRALLLQFQRSSLKAAHVRTDMLEAFFSRDKGVRSSDLGRAEVLAEAAHPAPTYSIPAPHLATLAELAPLGSMVGPGDMLARLIVLDRETIVTAQSAGTVALHHHAAGGLVEYGEPLLALAD